MVTVTEALIVKTLWPGAPARMRVAKTPAPWTVRFLVKTIPKGSTNLPQPMLIVSPGLAICTACATLEQGSACEQVALSAPALVT